MSSASDPDDSPNVCISCGQPLKSTFAGDQCMACLLQAAADSDVRLSESPTDDYLPTIDDYVIHEQIARGGMGVVYRGEQVSLKRPVAIKMILGGQLATTEMVRRFRTEAEAAARLDHPGIVPIYEIGEHETQHFFSMKLIDGENLSQCRDQLVLNRDSTQSQSRDDQNAIAELISRVARAADFAHQHGVLHRDIKPSNILIDRDGNPYLTDFGLAKLTGEDRTQLTSSSALGSPSYMSPEQASGTSDDLTVATDVYGLGALLYELLTGRPPFLGRNAVDTVRQVIMVEPTSPKAINPRVHVDLETIALRCLQKQPGQRYPSANALADELDRFLRGEPIHSRPISPLQVTWRWIKRNPVPSALTLLLLVCLVLGFAGVTWQWRRAESVNEDLNESVSRLERSRITQLAENGNARQALSYLARRLRQDPSDRNAAAYAMSVLDQVPLPVPHAPPIRLPNNESHIRMAKITPDGKTVITVGSDRSLQFWNADNSQPLCSPVKLDHVISQIVLGPNGDRLACSSGKSVHLFETSSCQQIASIHQESEVTALNFAGVQDLFAASGKAIRLFDLSEVRKLNDEITATRTFNLGQSVSRINVSGDGRVVVGLGQGGDIKAWTIDGKELVFFNDVPYRAVDINHDGTRMVTVQRVRDDVIQIRNATTGAILSQSDRIPGGLRFFDMDATGDRVAGAQLDDWIQLFDARTGQSTSSRLQHRGRVTQMKFIDGGRKLLALSSHNDLRLWNCVDGSPVCEPIVLAGGVKLADVSDDGHLVLSGSTSTGVMNAKVDEIQVWFVRKPRTPPSRTINPDHMYLTSVAVSPDQKWMASSAAVYTPNGRGLKRDLVVVNNRTGKLAMSETTKTDVYGAGFSPESDLMFGVTTAGIIRVYSVPNFQLLYEPIDARGRIQPSRLSPDGRTLATGYADGRFALWEIETGKQLWLSRHSKARLNEVVFSPNGQYVLSTSNDGSAVVWDHESGKRISTFDGHKTAMYTADIGPQSKLAIVGGDESYASIIELKTGRELLTVPHQARLNAVAFAPSGEFVATGSRDRTAAIWDAKSGQLHKRFLRHPSSVCALQFSPNSRQLFTSTNAGLRLWDVATAEPLTVQLPQPMQGTLGVGGDGILPHFVNSGKGIQSSAGFAPRVWPVSTPSEEAPDWFPEFLETVAMGYVREGEDTPNFIGAIQFHTFRKTFNKNDSDDYYARCVRDWLNESSSSGD